ncbi:MAG: hypothetical protein WCX65_19950 [bacterium]
MKKATTIKAMLMASLIATATLLAGCGGGGSSPATGRGTMKLKLDVPRTALSPGSTSTLAASATVTVDSYTSKGVTTLAGANLAFTQTCAYDTTYACTQTGGDFFISEIPAGSNYIVKAQLDMTSTYTEQTVVAPRAANSTYTFSQYFGALVDDVADGVTSDISVNGASTIVALAAMRYADKNEAYLSDTSVVTDAVIEAIRSYVNTAVANHNLSAYPFTCIQSGYPRTANGASSTCLDPFVRSNWTSDFISQIDAILASSPLPGTASYIQGSFCSQGSGTNPYFFTMKNSIYVDGSGSAQWTNISNSIGDSIPSRIMDVSQITPGHTFTMSSEGRHGALSLDGNVLADVVTDPLQPQLCVDIAVKKSTAATAALMNGDYVVSELRGEFNYSFSPETTRSVAHLDGVSAGTYQSLSKSSEGDLDSGTFTFTINPDGTFTMIDPIEGTDYGIVSPDGNMFLIIDTDIQYGSVGILVGVKKSSTMVASNMIGTYHLAQFGVDRTTVDGTAWFPDTEYGTYAISTAGSGVYTSLFNSNNSTQDSQNTTYTGAADGTFTITGDDGAGIVYPDGSMIFMSDTSLTADDFINFSIGIKTTP